MEIALRATNMLVFLRILEGLTGTQLDGSDLSLYSEIAKKAVPSPTFWVSDAPEETVIAFAEEIQLPAHPYLPHFARDLALGYYRFFWTKAQQSSRAAN